MPARRSAVPTGRQEAKEGQSVDPLAAKYPGWSPYNYCLNNPLSNTDPNGEWVWGAVIGAAVEYASQSIEKGDWSLNNKEWGKIAVAAGTGALSGGLSALAKAEKITKLTAVGLDVALNVAEGQANSLIEKGELSGKKAVSDVLVGVAGEKLSDMAGKVAKKLGGETVNVLKRDADRKTNIALKSTKTSKVENAKKAIEKYNGYGVDGKVATTTKEVVKKEVDKAVDEVIK